MQPSQYRYNEGFTVVRGKQYFVDGRIEWPAPTPEEVATVKTDNSYYTHGGPCASHNGLLYGNDNSNVREGTTRLTKSRLPVDPEAEGRFRSNQKTFVEGHSGLIRMLRERYEPHFFEYLGTELEAEFHHDDPHEKKDLRIQSWKDILDHNVLHDEIWNLPGTYGLYKMKVFEIAKPDKTARMIADLGCPASLQGFRIAEFMKNAMFNEPFLYEGGSIEFCKEPSPWSLAEIFKKLIDPPGRFYFVYFSDDACLSVRVNGEVLRYNVDISSCDASHTESLFDMYVKIHPPHHQRDAVKLVSQCRQPLTIVDLYNKKRKITLEPKEPRLYSGVTITTIVNNLANVLIAVSIAESDISSGEDVISAAAKAGYIVTCENCANWHELQFLKHSPVLDTSGDLRPLLNIGVLLRLSGTAKGDYPGSKNESVRLRCDRHQSSLLRGAYPQAKFSLIENLKRTCAYATQKHSTTDRATKLLTAYKVVDSPTYPEFTVDSTEVYARYGLTELEMAELDSDFGSCGFCDHYASSGTNAIYKKDYGLEAAFLTFPPEETLPSHWSR